MNIVGDYARKFTKKITLKPPRPLKKRTQLPVVIKSTNYSGSLSLSTFPLKSDNHDLGQPLRAAPAHARH